MDTVKEWNRLSASVFPESYKSGLFKARVSRYLHEALHEKKIMRYVHNF